MGYHTDADKASYTDYGPHIFRYRSLGRLREQHTSDADVSRGLFRVYFCQLLFVLKCLFWGYLRFPMVLCVFDYVLT
jgi:hypothetical protein